MKIVTTRRLSQLFFFLLCVWLCFVTVLGEAWWQLRGWPINFFMNLNPLNGLITWITTGRIYAGLLWGCLTLILTILLGRFFCGWVCPFGTLQQMVGYIAHRGKKVTEKTRLNAYHPLQSIKYLLLFFFLVSAAGHLIFPHVYVRSIHSGLLDPICLITRGINLAVTPALQALMPQLPLSKRIYPQTDTVALLFFIAITGVVFIPRVYCRYICPLGALLGLCSRYSLWRIGKKDEGCNHCRMCDVACEGACAPSDKIRLSECILCMNCVDRCPKDLVGYRTGTSVDGEHVLPDISRRSFLISVTSGAVSVPVLYTSSVTGANWNPGVIRPPGALDEHAFLSRCIKCGQCMKICPTNVIHPAGLETGIEGLWTPLLNFRTGTSGCQINCIACGHVCPTAAIRPLTIAERTGTAAYETNGPVVIGTAFVDRSRCLPWAMDTPCIVCQENCPVSPKAIGVIERFVRVRSQPELTVTVADSTEISLDTRQPLKIDVATGDYYCRVEGTGDQIPRLITGNTQTRILISNAVPWDSPPSPGQTVTILIKLQQPIIHPEQCVGCGTCEHECPVKGKRAIRVSAENESRNREHRLTL